MTILHGSVENPINTLPALKVDAFEKLRAAESAWYAYACACDVGRARERAFEIYENIRVASRVAL